MKPTERLQEALYKEMVGHIKETDLSVPFRQDGYFYYSRTEQGKQYPTWCRKKGSIDAAEEIVLDLNQLAKGEKFLGLGAFVVSDDGHLLAHSTDTTGFRQNTLRVRDLRSGQNDGLPRIQVRDFRSGESHSVAFPEPAYAAFPAENHEYNTTLFRYSYQSLVTPNSVYDYDVETRGSKLLKQEEVPGYDPTKYRSERLWATAADGTRIPISLVYRKDFERDGSRPCLLTGYGSYGFLYPVTFNSARLSLLDRGFAFAIAPIRGGGETGKAWHDQGRMMNKRNTFTDFVAAAELLLAEQITSRDRLVITCGSAGGLLMPAATNLRPDLFKAVVLLVPFVDVVNTMLDASLPLTVPEYEEWGNPQKKEEYDTLKTYCPYTNLASKAYSSLLVKTSFNDSQVMYWEPAKYAAKLRALKTDSNPLLLRANMAAGHGGASGRYDHLRETAFEYAFMLWQVGLQ